jgi:hypothetical protein
MNTESRSIPRGVALALAPLVWLIAIPLGHGVIPWALSLAGRRYGWQEGTPAYWHLLGLVPIAAGAFVLLWVMVLGFTRRFPNVLS